MYFGVRLNFFLGEEFLVVISCHEGLFFFNNVILVRFILLCFKRKLYI